MDWGIGNSERRRQGLRVGANMQCDIYHPFQILADLMTIVEKGRDLRPGSRPWAYAASYQKPMSVRSRSSQMPRFWHGRYPGSSEFKLMPDIMTAREQARTFNGLRVVDDRAAFKDADIIYAKSWETMVHARCEEGIQDHCQIQALDH